MHLGSRHHEVRERKLKMMESRYSDLAATGIEARNRKRVDSSSKEENVKKSYALARQRVRQKIERDREQKKRDAEKKRERAEKSDGSKLQEECKQRVRARMQKQKAKTRMKISEELSKNRSAALKEKIEKAKSEAQKRVHNVRAAERLREEQKIERLIFKQNTSIEAINVARLLSSHFEEKLDFKPQFKREMQGRLDKLLTSDRVGEFYL